ARKAARRFQRIDQRIVILAVAGGLHDDIAGEAEIVAQPEQRLLRRIAGRVFPLRRVREEMRRAENMAMRIDRAGRRLKGRLRRVGVKGQVIGIHHAVSVSCAKTTPSNNLRAVRRMEELATSPASFISRMTDVSPLGCSLESVFLRPSGMTASVAAGDPLSAAAVATVTAPRTPIEAWQRCGIKVRVESAPPFVAGLTMHIFGTVLVVTSPRFINDPAFRRSVSSRSFSAVFASSSSRLSRPVIPMSEARRMTEGMPLSMSVTSIPSM